MFEMQVILSVIGFMAVVAWVLWVTICIQELKDTEKGKANGTTRNFD
jgi:hypothetical protein